MYQLVYWSNTTGLITARRSGAAGGTQNAAFFGGGANSLSSTEEWNGIAWTYSSNMNVTRAGDLNGNGTQSRGLATGGITPAYLSCTEKYNHTGITYQPIYLNLNDLQRYANCGGY